MFDSCFHFTPDENVIFCESLRSPSGNQLKIAGLPFSVGTNHRSTTSQWNATQWNSPRGLEWTGGKSNLVNNGNVKVSTTLLSVEEKWWDCLWNGPGTVVEILRCRICSWRLFTLWSEWKKGRWWPQRRNVRWILSDFSSSGMGIKLSSCFGRDFGWLSKVFSIWIEVGKRRDPPEGSWFICFVNIVGGWLVLHLKQFCEKNKGK